MIKKINLLVFCQHKGIARRSARNRYSLFLKVSIQVYQRMKLISRPKSQKAVYYHLTAFHPVFRRNASVVLQQKTNIFLIDRLAQLSLKISNLCFFRLVRFVGFDEVF